MIRKVDLDNAGGIAHFYVAEPLMSGDCDTLTPAADKYGIRETSEDVCGNVLDRIHSLRFDLGAADGMQDITRLLDGLECQVERVRSYSISDFEYLTF